MKIADLPGYYQQYISYRETPILLSTKYTTAYSLHILRMSKFPTNNRKLNNLFSRGELFYPKLAPLIYNKFRGAIRPYVIVLFYLGSTGIIRIKPNVSISDIVVVNDSTIISGNINVLEAVELNLY